MELISHFVEWLVAALRPALGYRPFRRGNDRRGERASGIGREPTCDEELGETTAPRPEYLARSVTELGRFGTDRHGQHRAAS
jgi:hypothetical protein